MDQVNIKTEITPYQITSAVWMVPCQINTTLPSYTPLITPFGPHIKISGKFSRNVWTSKEDRALKKIVKEHGPQNWNRLALLLNKTIYNGLQIRLGKQCRERWLGSLRPGISKRKWTGEEDSRLISVQMTQGNKWSIIKNQFPGRSETQLKNRWKRLKRILSLEQKKLRTGEAKSQDFLEPWTYFRWDKFSLDS